MWEEYKEKDDRIIRPVNGNEVFTTGIYLNVTDVFPKFSTDEFTKNIQENLSKIQVFNYAIKKLDEHLFWINKPFQAHVKEVEWTENEEIENFLKNEDKTVIPFPPLLEENNDVFILFSFKICQLKNDKTKLTFSAMHAISDGRTIFNMFDLIRKVINGEKLEKNDESLPSFTQRENYQNYDESFETPPKVWNDIQELSILPELSPPYQYITIHNIYDYAPIAKFSKENSITVQAMLIAMMTRATRRYKNLPKETPIWNTTPSDTRASPYATETYKNKKFYSNAAGLYPCVVGQETLMEDLKHCMEKLLESKNTYDNVRQLISCSSIIDPETLQFTPKGEFPNFHTKALVNTSNIGRVNGNMPLFYLQYNSFIPQYNFFYHCYHTEDKLFISGLMPINFDKTYINYIKEEMDNIFIPENISKHN